MAALHFQLVLRPQRFWLMLLLFAAAGVYCHCSYLGASDSIPEEANSDNTDQMLLTDEMGSAVELSAPLQGAAEKDAAPQAAEAATPYTDTENTPQDTPKSLLHDSLKTNRISPSKLGGNLRRSPWPVVLATGSLLFLIITMAGKHSAKKKTESARQKDLSKLSVDGEISVELLPQGEDFDEEALNELLALQRDEEAAKEILSLLERRQKDAEAQKAADGADEEEAKELQQTRERLRRAREARDLAKLELELALVLQDAKKESPASCLARIFREKEALREQEACLLKGVTTTDSFDRVKEAKEAQLAALSASLANWKREIEAAEKRLMQREQTEETGAPLDEETPAAPKEKERKNTEGQREEGPPPAPALSEEEGGPPGPAVSEEEEAMAAEVAEAEKLVGESKAELEKLVKAQAGYTEGSLLLQDLEKQLSDYKKEILSSKAEEIEPEEEDRSKKVERLYPEERRLLEAEQTLRLLQSKETSIQAELALLSHKQEEASLMKVYYDYFTSKARVKDEEISKTGETGQDQLPAADVAAASEDKTQLAEDELLKIERERKRLDDKRESRKILTELLTEVRADIVNAQTKVLLHQRIAADLPTIQAQRLRFPGAYAVARFLTSYARIHNLSKMLADLEAMHAKFAKALLDHRGQGSAMRRYWHQFGAPITDDFLTGFTEVCKIGYFLRLGERLAKDELKSYRNIESLQKYSFEELFVKYRNGMEDRLFNSYVRQEWTAIENEKGILKGAIERIEKDVQQLRQTLTNIAHARWWSRNFPQQQLLAFAHIIKQEHWLKYHKEMLERLQKVTEEDVHKRIQEVFLKAAWTARKRRKLYGNDPEVLAAIRKAYEAAISREEERIKFVLDLFGKTETRYELPASMKPFPQFAPPPEREQKPLEQVLIKDVLQLRKKEKYSKDSK